MKPQMALTGILPSGEEFAASVALDVIVLRVGDRTCIAHPRWMTDDQIEQLVAQLRAAGHRGAV